MFLVGTCVVIPAVDLFVLNTVEMNTGALICNSCGHSHLNWPGFMLVSMSDMST